MNRTTTSTDYADFADRNDSGEIVGLGPNFDLSKVAHEDSFREEEVRNRGRVYNKERTADSQFFGLSAVYCLLSTFCFLIGCASVLNIALLKLSVLGGEKRR
jgi:hypothetical protein